MTQMLLAFWLSFSSSQVHVVLDAGHGTGLNQGNTSGKCESESTTTLRLANRLKVALEAKNDVRVTLTRLTNNGMSYRERKRLVERLRADAFMSLHSDVRFDTGPFVNTSGCYETTGGTGFAVLYSDEGRFSKRHYQLGKRVADSLVAHGFKAYDGFDYEGIYEKTAEGLFVDRHLRRQRIYLLRALRVPSIIIETHQALNPNDVEHWEKAETISKCADALREVLLKLKR